MTATHRTDDPLGQLYDDFAHDHLNPLWTQLGDLMPTVPSPKAVPFVWKWSTLYPLAQRAGDLVPVGRGGERRAIALANPGLGGAPFVTPTLWAAIQYLGPKETAPEHRHAQNAFRFVVEGEGVWTVPNAIRQVQGSADWSVRRRHRSGIRGVRTGLGSRAGLRDR